jgi:hypothetical protein
MQVTVTHAEEMVMPVHLEILYGDGRTEQRMVPVEAFTISDTFTVSIDAAGIESITIDPNEILPDIARQNNTWRLRD